MIFLRSWNEVTNNKTVLGQNLLYVLFTPLCWLFTTAFFLWILRSGGWYSFSQFNWEQLLFLFYFSFFLFISCPAVIKAANDSVFLVLNKDSLALNKKIPRRNRTKYQQIFLGSGIINYIYSLSFLAHSNFFYNEH